MMVSTTGREPKLTEPQWELLRDAEMGTPCVKAYAPAQRLVKLGLAQWTKDDEYGGILDITDAGRRRSFPRRR